MFRVHSAGGGGPSHARSPSRRVHPDNRHPLADVAHPLLWRVLLGLLSADWVLRRLKGLA